MGKLICGQPERSNIYRGIQKRKSAIKMVVKYQYCIKFHNFISSKRGEMNKKVFFHFDTVSDIL